MSEKVKVIGLILGTSLVMIGLIGCGFSESNDNDVDSEVVVASEGIDSDIYYEQLEEYFNQLVKVNRETFDNIHLNELNEANEKQTIESLNSFLIFSKAFDVTPKSNADEIMHDSFIDLKYDAESMVEYGLQYVYKKERVYKELHKDNYTNVRVHMQMMSEIEKQYYK